MTLGSSKRSDTAVQDCVMCGEPAGVDNPLCSRDCLLEARHELDDNVALLHQQGIDGERRAALTARNGDLTSALIRWSP